VYCSDIIIGDLVCLKSWNFSEDDAGWISIPSDYGIVIEIIEIEHEYIFIDQKIRCYDYVIYWSVNRTTETLPDVVIDKFSNWLRRDNER